MTDSLHWEALGANDDAVEIPEESVCNTSLLGILLISDPATSEHQPSRHFLLTFERDQRDLELVERDEQSSRSQSMAHAQPVEHLRGVKDENEGYD